MATEPERRRLLFCIISYLLREGGRIEGSGGTAGGGGGGRRGVEEGKEDKNKRM